jgi:membrane fusion protein (multidrug efflux system)
VNELTPTTELKIERELRELDPQHSLPALHDFLGRVQAERKLTGRRLAALVGAVAVFIAVSFYGWHYWTIGRFEVSTNDAYVQADSTIIAPKVGGYLSQVLVTDNQPVKAGQLLAKIDDRDFVTALDQAKANVAAAQADIDNLNASIKEQQAVISQAHATVDVDKANLIFQQEDNDRYAKLAAQGSGTIQTAQQTRSKLGIALATLAHDTAAVDAAERQTSVLQAQLGKADAALAQNDAMQQQAELNLGYTNIVAPIDGVVGDRTLRIGQLVQAGTQLMAVVPLNQVYIVANFEETQLTDVHRGQPVQIEVDTFPGEVITGHVDSIAPASGQEFALLPPDNATGNFTKIVQRVPVKIVMDPNDPLLGRLRPGLSVEPTINTRGKDA